MSTGTIKPQASAVAGRARRWPALVLLCTAYFMVILDSQIVILALPSIAGELALTPGEAQWVLSANLLTFGGLLLLGGRAADLLGRRRMFAAGTALFLIVSLVCGIAPNAEVLIGARALHGVSSALMAPSALSILMTTFEEGSERNRALAAWAGIAGIGATVGSLLGGTITDGLGWEWIFFVNVPVAAAMLALTPLLLAESRDRGRRATFDGAGAVTITGALVLLVYAVVKAPEVGWSDGLTVGLFAGAAVLIGLFVVVEARSAAPLMPLRLFRARTVSGGNAVMLVLGMLAFGVMVAVSQYTQQVLGYSPLKVGFATAVMPAMAVVGAYASQPVLNRFGFRPVAAASVFLLGTACVLFTQVSVDSPYFGYVFFGLLVLGPGVGAGTTAATAAALTGVAERDSGLASGLNTAGFQIGGAFGVAIVSTVIVTETGGAMAPGILTEGFQSGFLACTGIAVAGLVLSTVVPRHGSRAVRASR